MVDRGGEFHFYKIYDHHTWQVQLGVGEMIHLGQITIKILN